MNKNPSTVKELEGMSYVDFVAFINQWNVPPGAHCTVSKWRIFGNVSRDSRVLEVACTTGFSSREIAHQSGCTALGFDVSASSVNMAKWNNISYPTPGVGFKKSSELANFHSLFYFQPQGLTFGSFL